MRLFLHYLEIIFTAAGVAVVFIVTGLFTPAGMSPWQVAAVTATAVGVIHGLLFWFIRQRQRQARHETIAELRAVLQDLVNNQLAVIQAMTELRQERPAEAQRAAGYISQAVTTISEALRHIDDDRLKTWQRKYSQAANPGR